MKRTLGHLHEMVALLVREELVKDEGARAVEGKDLDVLGVEAPAAGGDGLRREVEVEGW